MEETRIIDGHKYSKSDDEHFWMDYDTKGHMVCTCESTQFHLIHSDYYETTAICVACKRSEIIHVG
jgi:hypothetical protein